MPDNEGMTRELSGGQLRELPGEPGAPVLREWSARGKRWPADHEMHTGEVAIYVARGAIEVEVGGDIHALNEGDTVRFDGTIPHRLRRTGGTGRPAYCSAPPSVLMH